MAIMRIDSVAKIGTEDYLLMLLAGEYSDLGEGNIRIEAIDAYLNSNPDEAELFDQETIIRVKRKIQAVEDALMAGRAGTLQSLNVNGSTNFKNRLS